MIAPDAASRCHERMNDCKTSVLSMLKPRWRWAQFSLATMFVVVTVICVWLTMACSRNNQKHRAITAIENVGGSISYDYQWGTSGAFLADAKPPGPQCLRYLFGELYCAELVEIQLFSAPHSHPSEFTDAEAAKLGALSRLRWLVLMDTAVTDAGLQHLRDLGNLERLDLEGAMVTDAGVDELQRALPNCKIYH